MADLNTKQVAAACGTDPKTLRRFLRAVVRKRGGTVGEDTPGQGGRYSFDEDEVPSIKEGFEAWLAAKAEKATAVEEAEEEILADGADALDEDDESDEDLELADLDVVENDEDDEDLEEVG
jgi:deoxyribodipyrimidine photolyase-like uncharacterized protein